jgi:hypothetical protein
VANGETLLFLHADNWLAPSVGEQMRRTFAHKGLLHVAFRQRIEASGCKYRLLENGNAARVRLLGLPYGDQGIAVRAETFWRLGGFPPVPIMEDLQLMRKLRAWAWPALLEGPIYVNPRRWQQRGVVGQTLRNWSLVAAHTLGVSPAQLARFYPPHS